MPGHAQKWRLHTLTPGTWRFKCVAGYLESGFMRVQKEIGGVWITQGDAYTDGTTYDLTLSADTPIRLNIVSVEGESRTYDCAVQLL